MKQFNNLKVGIDIRNIGKKRTGDEAVFFELVKNLERVTRNVKRERRYNYKFLLFTDITDGEVLKDIKKGLGIENRKDFEIVSLKSKNKFIWNLWTLPKHLRKHPVDIYHTQYITPFFVPRKIKIITHIHDVSFKVYKRFIKWSDLLFLSVLIPMSIRRADKIIAVSKFTKNEIIKYYSKSLFTLLCKKRELREKVEVVYNAVSSPFRKGRVREGFEKREGKESIQINDSFQIPLNPPFPKGENVRKKYNLPEKYILYLGTLQPRKNIPTLIEAYAKIKNKIPDAGLVIAGNLQAHNMDPKILNIKYQISNKTLNPNNKLNKKKNLLFRNLTLNWNLDFEICNFVHFPGFIDEEDKMDIIAGARLFVFPSLYEGFGIPILEAMSQNVPVAASDIPSLEEVGGNAYAKFNPRDLDEIAEKLYTVCMDENLRKKLINLGRSRVKFFSWEKSAKRMLEIYESLIRKIR